MRDLAAYEAKYNEPGFEEIQVRYRRKKILLEMEKAQARRVVEIGCGMEPLFLYYPSFQEYYFFEPGELFYQNAARLAQAYGAERIRGYRMPFTLVEEVRKAKPDLIVCASLLHEVENPGSLLRAIRDTASQDTLIHLNVPNALSLHRRLARVMGLLRDEHDFSERNQQMMQHRVFDENSLISLVESCGLEVLEKGSIFLKPFSHAQMWELRKSGFLTDRMLDGFYDLTEEMPGLGSELWVNCRIRKAQGEEQG